MGIRDVKDVVQGMFDSTYVFQFHRSDAMYFATFAVEAFDLISDKVWSVIRKSTFEGRQVHIVH